MQLSASFILILASLTTITLGATLSDLAVPRTADSSNDDDCATLGGPMPKSNLPDGVITNDVRKCVGHPLGKGVDAQACWTASPYGCSSDGYCWKVCGNNGEWCWTAANKGQGAWLRCSTYTDCHATDSCGGTCSC
ncbi:hypothetical protein Hypma_014810 [Hypsizygus marmoreus]|uniref:Uncharacterized protein n=1 Tax=Hypsizygus marmoreus TaxID=39966 RepID=A0A369KCI8_HYPMA|nr:hypothetical protein Hypma_014810 [Hypsizygus marmoreus]